MDFRVANAYDRMVKERLHAGEAKEIGVPYNLVRHETLEWVKSEPLEFPEHDVALVIRGKTDKQFYTDDGGLVIVDAKAGDGDPDRYWMQMMMYLFAKERPMEAVPIEVEAIGILQWALSEVEFKLNAQKSMAALTAPLRWYELTIDRETCLGKLGEVAAVAGRATPPPSGNWCEFCKTVELAKALDKSAMSEDEQEEERQ